jgi:hypothetical protein
MLFQLAVQGMEKALSNYEKFCRENALGYSNDFLRSVLLGRAWKIFADDQRKLDLILI